MARGFLGLIRTFGWKRVAIITQNENLFTVVREGRVAREKNDATNENISLQ